MNRTYSIKKENPMTEPVTQAQDHDRRIACPCENRGLEGIAEQIAEQGRQTNARFDSLTRWLVGMQVASLIALGTLILSRLA